VSTPTAPTRTGATEPPGTAGRPRRFDRLAPTLALAAVSASVAIGLARLIDGSSWVAPVMVAAVLPHLIGWSTRRRTGPVAVLASVLGLVVLVVWGLEAHTTSHGLPLGATWRTLGSDLTVGPRLLRDHAVPVPARTGATLLAVVVLWVMATVADRLATARRAVVGALAPGIAVFVWTAAITAGADRSTLTSIGAIAFVVSGGIFVVLQRRALSAEQVARSTRTDVGVADGERQRRHAALLVATATALIAAVVGVLLAPLLPGSDAPPLFDVRSHDRGSSTYQTAVPPLVDVADQLKRGQRVELFTVSSSAAEYWRTVALDDYTGANGGQWVLRASGGSISTGLSDPVPAGAVRQQYRIGALTERWMPAALRPVSVDRPNTLVVDSSRTLVTRSGSVTGLSYSVASVPPPAITTDAQRRAAAAPAPASLAVDTRLPADVPQSVRDLAASITAGTTSPFERARQLRDYFRSGAFTYDTSVDLSDAADATVEFLRLKRGFCVQFASAYALLARSVGLPTRVAVGFTPGALDAATGRYRVTNYEAHAWPEVWLAGVGWTNQFDPTPQSTQPGGSDLPGDTASIPLPPPPAPALPTTTVTGPSATTVPGAPMTTPATVPGPTPGGGGAGAGAGGADPSGSAPLLWMIALAAVAGALAGAVPFAKALRRRHRRREADPAECVAGAWAEAVDRLRDLGRPRPTAETPVEVAAGSPPLVGPAAAPSLARVAVSHTRAQFGPVAVTTADADTAWHDLVEFERALTRHVGRTDRVRARWSTASLRSLRRAPSGRASADRRSRTSP